MEPQNGVKSWQWVVTVIVIIVLIIIGFMVFGGKKTDTTMTPDQTTDQMATSKEVNRIVMSDQYPGNVVYLSSVQLAKAGWVEIHKDSNGTPGAYIGSAWFEAGINPGKVMLTQPTVEGGIYYAMLHSDDGDKKFDASKDLPLKDSKGNIIMKLFRASAAVGEIKG